MTLPELIERWRTRTDEWCRLGITVDGAKVADEIVTDLETLARPSRTPSRRIVAADGPRRDRGEATEGEPRVRVPRKAACWKLTVGGYGHTVTVLEHEPGGSLYLHWRDPSLPNRVLRSLRHTDRAAREGRASSPHAAPGRNRRRANRARRTVRIVRALRARRERPQERRAAVRGPPPHRRMDRGTPRGARRAGDRRADAGSVRERAPDGPTRRHR